MHFQPSPQSVDEALDWHSAITDSVTIHRSLVLSGLTPGAPTSYARFVGLTLSEIDAFFRDEQSEIDGMCVVNIVAAAEAAIRSDFRTRVHRNQKDPVSQAYVAYHGALSGLKKYRPDFDKAGILDALKGAHAIPDHLVTAFRHMLRIRHWYAHGRHWLLTTSASHDPIDVHATSTNLLAALAAI